MQRGIVHIALCVNEYNARWILIVMLFITDSVLSVHAQFDSYYHVLLLRNTFLARPNLSLSNFQMIEFYPGEHELVQIEYLLFDLSQSSARF